MRGGLQIGLGFPAPTPFPGLLSLCISGRSGAARLQPAILVLRGSGQSEPVRPRGVTRFRPIPGEDSAGLSGSAVRMVCLGHPRSQARPKLARQRSSVGRSSSPGPPGCITLPSRRSEERPRLMVSRCRRAGGPLGAIAPDWWICYVANRFSCGARSDRRRSG